MADGAAGVLVVEGEHDTRVAIQRILTDHGVDCTSAESGQQALEYAADGSIGVAIVDVRLPDSDGVALLERLREVRPSLRVVMLSGSTDQEHVLEALRKGACDYLAKPLHDEELVLAVGRAQENYRLSADWSRLRVRLGRLVARMEELANRVSGLEGERRDEVLHDAAVRAASDVLGATKTSLMLLDESGKTLRVAAAVRSDIATGQMDAVVAGERVAGNMLTRAEPVLVKNVESHPTFSGFSVAGRYESSSFAVAPLRRGAEAMGVLCATDREGGGEFSNDDLSLLRLLAMQVAGSMAHAASPAAREVAPPPPAELARMVSAARVVEPPPKDTEVADLERDAEMVRQICQAVVDEVEPERSIRAALRAIAESIPAAPVSLFLIDPSTGELVKEGECDGGVGTDAERLPRNRGLTGTVLQTGHMVASRAPNADSRFDRVVDTPEGGKVRPFLCVPLRLKGKVAGVLRAFLYEGDTPCPRTGEAIAAALSAAVRSVLLYRSLVESIEEVAEARRGARR